MTERQKRIDFITDAMYLYMIELTTLASDLEYIDLNKDGDDLRNIVGQLEQLLIRILHRKHKRKITA